MGQRFCKSCRQCSSSRAESGWSSDSNCLPGANTLCARGRPCSSCKGKATYSRGEYLSRAAECVASCAACAPAAPPLSQPARCLRHSRHLASTDGAEYKPDCPQKSTQAACGLACCHTAKCDTRAETHTADGPHRAQCTDWLCMDMEAQNAYVLRLSSLRLQTAPLQAHHAYRLAMPPHANVQSSKRRSKAIAAVSALYSVLRRSGGLLSRVDEKLPQPRTHGHFIVKYGLRLRVQDLAALSHSLPVHIESSIHVVVDDERNDVLRFMILPGQDTPYANGAFIFDCLLPEDYPESSPKVCFLTTGGGQIRFNPNLYSNGVVCLSLLGTWAGPAWQPGTSTLLQVLVSIQAMVLCKDPYYNEPGYEASRSTTQGKAASLAYNKRVWGATVNVAILKPLQAPDQQPHGCFRGVLMMHFKNKRGTILRHMQQSPVAVQQAVATCLDNLV